MSLLLTISLHASGRGRFSGGAGDRVYTSSFVGQAEIPRLAKKNGGKHQRG
jgi:hypothetical protein